MYVDEILDVQLIERIYCVTGTAEESDWLTVMEELFLQTAELHGHHPTFITRCFRRVSIDQTLRRYISGMVKQGSRCTRYSVLLDLGSGIVDDVL